MDIVAFDIQTTPDFFAARKLWNLGDLGDRETAAVMLSKRRQETQGESNFILAHLHQVVAISVVHRESDSINVHSLGDGLSSEEEIVTRFFKLIGSHSPTIVSWNGNRFNLPVLHYRALFNKVSAPYDRNIDDNEDFSVGTYFNRFAWRHVDLMDAIAGYQASTFSLIDQVACLLGFPADLENRRTSWTIGNYEEGTTLAREFGEIGALKIWLIYLRFQYLRGQISDNELETELNLTQSFLRDSKLNYFREFLEEWATL